MQPQAAFLSSIEPGHELQALRPATRCEAGQRWVWDGVLFEILHPAAADYQGTPRPNAVSCVLRVASAGESGGVGEQQVALLAGDIEKPQENALLARAAIQPVTLLLVPHHGSKTSSSEAFLEAAAPRIAWVQAGYRNRFGHPAPPVMARYAARGVRVVDSVHCGAAGWSSAAPDEVRCQRDDARRYWHHRPPPG
jgi:competence protein ComEC